MDIKSFFLSENGAITVDWVVLTAGVVGLGLVAVSVAAGGVGALSRNISDTMVAETVTEMVAATIALTQTSVWNDPSSTSTEFSNVDQLSFSSLVDFAVGDEGILVEAGGTGRGFILYQHDGMLYLQAGSGNGTGESTSRGEASWAVQDGSFTVEGSMNADGGLALYIDGDLVDQSSFTAASLAGGNAGSISGGTSSVAINRGGFNANSPGHPGVTEISFYEGQTTGDELTPLD